MVENSTLESWEKLLSHNSSTTTTATISPSHEVDVGISVYTIILVVTATLIGCAVAGIAIFFVQKRARDRRKVHGEYRPQQEEQKHAKDLPYITPPNIEGLI
ncbi:hypothetical protein niasHS_013368 [Heterodera schachtii]|uniref:Uncharacterized protein n=1 Tax=Heterodera schachtii TaxID=97005 RepID=A0ABD2IC80_HETSC